MMYRMLMENPQYYLMVVVTVIVSITLHELAHGFTAIHHGDRTPEERGHMTANPLIHMGPFSIIMLLLNGIAWGSMPVDPTRLRGKFAEAMVYAAGPATNFALALLGLTALGVWYRFGGHYEAGAAASGQQFLLVFGVFNIVLGIFNLIPVPPLDGSGILASFSSSYARLVGDPGHSGTWMIAFIFVFLFVGDKIFSAGYFLAAKYISLFF